MSRRGLYIYVYVCVYIYIYYIYIYAYIYIYIYIYIQGFPRMLKIWELLRCSHYGVGGSSKFGGGACVNTCGKHGGDLRRW